MSSLFGTLSENDLENINRNVRTLATNQKQIVHDLDVSLSVLNLTRSQVAENRRSIMELIIVMQKLDSKILKMQQVFYQWFVRLEQLIHTYLQFQMIFDEIRKPRNLNELLIGIDTKLPNNFELPRNLQKKDLVLL